MYTQKLAVTVGLKGIDPVHLSSDISNSDQFSSSLIKCKHDKPKLGLAHPLGIPLIYTPGLTQSHGGLLLDGAN